MKVQVTAALALAAQTALTASDVPATAADMEMRIAAQLATLEGAGIGVHFIHLVKALVNPCVSSVCGGWNIVKKFRHGFSYRAYVSNVSI